MKKIEHKGWIYLVGQDKLENDTLVKTNSPECYWFHLKDQPSCHVILQFETDQPKDEQYKKRLRSALKHGCLLCKQHSKCIQHLPVTIMYTLLSNVEPTHIPGTVNVSSYSTMTI